MNIFLNSQIIVNGAADEFYKQPMYYGLGHFSKYIPEESIKIDVQLINNSKLFATAVLRPDGKRAVVILNQSDDEKIVRLVDIDVGTLEFQCQARSIHTVVYG